MGRRSIRIAAVALVAGLATLAAEKAPTSARVGFSTFREESGRFVVFVDGYPASIARGTAYVPVPVAVAMTKSGHSLTFTPESFTLIDAKGNAVPAAGYDELQKHYDRLNFDRTLLLERPIAVGSYITDLRQVPARFYPPVQGGTRIPRVELAPNTWFTDVLYFPRPPAGTEGVLRMRVSIPDEASIDVRFVASPNELS